MFALSIKGRLAGLWEKIRKLVESRLPESVPAAALADVTSVGGGAGSARTSPVMASLFPCLKSNKHGHVVGQKHTCNSFLLGPSDYKEREGFKAGAHTIIVSHWSATRNGQKARVA